MCKIIKIKKLKIQKLKLKDNLYSKIKINLRKTKNKK